MRSDLENVIHVDFIQADGAELAYVDSGPRDAEAFLLYRSLFFNHAMFNPLAALLNAAGYRAIGQDRSSDRPQLARAGAKVLAAYLGTAAERVATRSAASVSHANPDSCSTLRGRPELAARSPDGTPGHRMSVTYCLNTRPHDDHAGYCSERRPRRTHPVTPS
jgi:hypothetical protein